MQEVHRFKLAVRFEDTLVCVSSLQTTEATDAICRRILTKTS